MNRPKNVALDQNVKKPQEIIAEPGKALPLEESSKNSDAEPEPKAHKKLNYYNPLRNYDTTQRQTFTLNS